MNAIAMITAPLIMTTTFATFTGPDAPVFAPGAPFLLAALLMLGLPRASRPRPPPRPPNRPETAPEGRKRRSPLQTACLALLF